LSDEQPKVTTFFFDGTHGKLIPAVLKAVGISVKLHMNQGWPSDMPDVDWIAECGKNNWVIVSGDKEIQRVPEERQAVIGAKCKVFMFDDGHETRTEDWAASLLVARDRLVEIAETANGPFFVTIRRCKVYGHISLPDFVIDTGAGWKVKTEQPKKETEVVPARQPKRSRRSQQARFDFVTTPIASSALQKYAPMIPHCDICASLFQNRLSVLEVRNMGTPRKFKP
jgi:hypothetical protein